MPESKIKPGQGTESAAEGSPLLAGQDQAYKELLDNNLAISQEILDTVRYIRHYIKWQSFWGFIRTLVVLIPIVASLLYWSPIIKVIKSNLNVIMSQQ